MGLGLFVVAIVSPYFLCFGTPDGKVACTGIIAVYVRDHNAGLIPYLDYPLEYPFTSGAIMLAVNLAAATSSIPEIFAIFFIPLFMGLFGCLTLWVFYKLGVGWKKALLYYVAAPAVVQFGFSFEYVMMWLFLMAYYSLKNGRDDLSALFLGLSAGAKYFPLFTLPVMASGVGSKLRYYAITLGTFALGMVAEVGLSPLNFLRSMSYLTGYGVEGSWIGLVFGKLIDYGHETTWDIGTSTHISLPQDYQLASAAIFLLACLLTYRSRKLKMEEKLLLVFASTFIFLWISAPQFIIAEGALLPLLSQRIKLSTVLIWEIIQVLCFAPLSFYLQYHSPLIIVYWFQVLAEMFLGMLVLSLIFLPERRPRR